MTSSAAYNFNDSKLLWTPSHPGHATCERLRREINMKRGLKLKDYNGLHAYSVSTYTFWLDLWDFMGIIASVPPRPDQIIVPGAIPERPSWFPSARLNYAENLLWRDDSAIAITAAYEYDLIPTRADKAQFSGVKQYTFHELRELVRIMAAGMKRAGVRVGDRVAAIITNSVTGIVIALAAASIGAIFSSTATDMGTSGILDRYRQIRPKILFASSEAVYAGKTINITGKIADIESDLRVGGHGLEKAVVLRSEKTGDLMHVPNCSTIDAFLTPTSAAEDYPLTFEQLPFDHPLYILYSSGTSGPPKCIVHAAGGALMNSKKDCNIAFGISPTDVYFQYTTTAWMMWPFMLSGLACGARIVLYEGSPFYPDVREYLKFIDWAGVTVLGTSPRFLSELQARNVDPLSIASPSVPFTGLREITVTGSVLTAQLMTWTHNAFGRNLHIGSSSGGTDVFCAFVTSVQSFPLYAGELQGPALGMAVSVYSPSGQPISDSSCTPGELVITRPHPSVPLYFLNDTPTHEKFVSAYFRSFPPGHDGVPVWRHGDFVIRNPATGGFVFLGRSDGVLNPSGVRFGSAEIYKLVDGDLAGLEAVKDVLCVGQRRKGEDDERVLLFLTMKEGYEGKLGKELRQRIRSVIREGLSRRHEPAGIFEVDDIPYTVNGKKIEIAVKQIVSGIDVVPSGTVSNPGSFKLYYKYRDFEKMMKEEEGVDMGRARKAKAKL
ncbi:acetoacetate-CoA ligase [Boletus edulis BED1]|uniref:Acetoacetate-CoA ligase n=1 Tax=Boletus edulis BED1 TaxID=1328754 RepID=A0AAD4C0G4_BOLED|nr:acetoacetate-CoA ligase [Boletus edulis BED1]